MVHRVAGDEDRPLELVEHALLERGIDVGKEDVRRTADGGGDVRTEVGEHVQLERQRVPHVEVLVIPSRPAKRTPRPDLEPGEVDAA